MTCLLLENGLPDSIDGVTIYPDYRNMIRFEQILDDSALNDVEKTVLGVKQLFEELPPGGMAQAVDRLQWFYRRGRDLKDGHTGVGKSNARAYDLVIDAGCIYASFLQAYRIDLTEIRFCTGGRLPLYWKTCRKILPWRSGCTCARWSCLR